MTLLVGLSLQNPDCVGRQEQVPRLLHTVGKGGASHTMVGSAVSNPSFTHGIQLRAEV